MAEQHEFGIIKAIRWTGENLKEVTDFVGVPKQYRHLANDAWDMYQGHVEHRGLRIVVDPRQLGDGWAPLLEIPQGAWIAVDNHTGRRDFFDPEEFAEIYGAKAEDATKAPKLYVSEEKLREAVQEANKWLKFPEAYDAIERYISPPPAGGNIWEDPWGPHNGYKRWEAIERLSALVAEEKDRRQAQGHGTRRLTDG